MLWLCCDGRTLQRSQACSIFLDNLGGRESSDAVPLRSDEELTPAERLAFLHRCCVHLLNFYD